MISPTWFFGMDVVFQLVFTLVTLAVSFFAFKIHKLTGEPKSKLLGISFLFFAIGYFVQSFFNFAIISTLGEEICTLAKINSIHTFELFGTYFYMMFALIGIVTLAYMTTLNTKTHNKKTYAILLVASLVGLFLSMNPVYFFYALSSLLLLFVVYYYAQNYSSNKKITSLIILLAFIFLLLSRIHYIFAANVATFYVLGNFLELGAYALILIDLLLMRRK